MKRTEIVYTNSAGSVQIRQSGKSWNIESSYGLNVDKLKQLHAALGELLTDLAASPPVPEEAEAVAPPL